MNDEAPVSVRRQCELLRVSRSGLYYEPVPDDAEDLALMRRLDELHLKWPFYGSRKLTLELRAEGHEINRKRAQRRLKFAFDPLGLLNPGKVFGTAHL